MSRVMIGAGNAERVECGGLAPLWNTAPGDEKIPKRRQAAALHTLRDLTNLNRQLKSTVRCLPQMKISVIIPVINERDHLPATLAAISRAAESTDLIAEVIVVDGGSDDGGREWISARKDVRLIDAELGRGAQLHAGAQVATGDALLFLHADCLLPPEAPKLIARALSDSRIAGGCFLIGFPEAAALSLRLIARGINARTLMARTGTGDQAIFARREIYELIGGFKPWPLFEDVDLVTRIKGAGRFAALNSKVTISPRRYLAHGPWRTTLLMYALRLGYWLGISPVKLKEWFVDVRR
jgi:rSAM/selenodomain-associated transferase 2